ncbi:unnamed protein product, partial [Closterium sp. NIES-54]
SLSTIHPTTVPARPMAIRTARLGTTSSASRCCAMRPVRRLYSWSWAGSRMERRCYSSPMTGMLGCCPC